MDGNVTVHLKNFKGFDLKILSKLYIVTIVKNKKPKGLDDIKKNLWLLNSTGLNVKTSPPSINNPNQMVADEKNKTFVTLSIDTLYKEYNLYLIDPPNNIE
jgi:hypothetical protein